MDVNYLIGLLIIIAFALLGYSHYEHLSQDITFTKSDIDDKEYLVRNMEDKKEAANLLAKIRMKLERELERTMNRLLHVCQQRQTVKVTSGGAARTNSPRQSNSVPR